MRRQRRCRLTLEALEDRYLLAGGFALVNLASDVPGLARTTDVNLVSPWGIAFSPTGPFWLADNGSAVSSLFDGGGGSFALAVALPQGSAPTGVVFNGGPGFAVSENGVAAPSRFLFVTESGTIAGWSAVVDPTHALPMVNNSASGAVYTGVALATAGTGDTFLYAADFNHATIDVFDQSFRPVARPGSFRDPAIPDGFAPFNIQNIGNLLYVTYAERDSDGLDNEPDVGNGFIDVYDTDGSLLRRFASHGPLDSPWGLALAPRDFGPFAGALLVGNNGDGHINAYARASGAFLGQLADDNGVPVTIPYLWALAVGNAHLGGDPETLFFTAGIDDGAHGLFGAIQGPARHGADTAGTGGFDPHAAGEPGDYPLPPRSGPALQAGTEVRLSPVVDFLPLAPASLVLVPTLSAAAPTSTRFGASVPDAAANAEGLVFAWNRPASLPGTDNYLIALSALLDVSASNHNPPVPGAATPGPDPRPSAPGSAPVVDANAAAGDAVSSDADIAVSAATAREQCAARLLPPLCEGESALWLTSRAEPTASSADEHEHATAVRDGSYPWLVGVLVCISSPLMWLYRAPGGNLLFRARGKFDSCRPNAAENSG